MFGMDTPEARASETPALRKLWLVILNCESLRAVHGCFLGWPRSAAAVHGQPDGSLGVAGPDSAGHGFGHNYVPQSLTLGFFAPPWFFPVKFL